MKICPEGAEFMHGDGRTVGQTDKTKLVVVFCNSAKKPKIVTFSVLYFSLPEIWMPALI
jgi:hypothetical protein